VHQRTDLSTPGTADLLVVPLSWASHDVSVAAVAAAEVQEQAKHSHFTNLPPHRSCVCAATTAAAIANLEETRDGYIAQM